MTGGSVTFAAAAAAARRRSRAVAMVPPPPRSAATATRTDGMFIDDDAVAVTKMATTTTLYPRTSTTASHLDWMTMMNRNRNRHDHRRHHCLSSWLSFSSSLSFGLWTLIPYRIRTSGSSLLLPLMQNEPPSWFGGNTRRFLSANKVTATTNSPTSSDDYSYGKAIAEMLQQEFQLTPAQFKERFTHPVFTKQQQQREISAVSLQRTLRRLRHLFQLTPKQLLELFQTSWGDLIYNHHNASNKINNNNIWKQADYLCALFDMDQDRMREAVLQYPNMLHPTTRDKLEYLLTTVFDGNELALLQALTSSNQVNLYQTILRHSLTTIQSRVQKAVAAAAATGTSFHHADPNNKTNVVAIQTLDLLELFRNDDSNTDEDDNDDNKDDLDHVDEDFPELPLQGIVDADNQDNRNAADSATTTASLQSKDYDHKIVFSDATAITMTTTTMMDGSSKPPDDDTLQVRQISQEEELESSKEIRQKKTDIVTIVGAESEPKSDSPKEKTAAIVARIAHETGLSNEQIMGLIKKHPGIRMMTPKTLEQQVRFYRDEPFHFSKEELGHIFLSVPALLPYKAQSVAKSSRDRLLRLFRDDQNTVRSVILSNPALLKMPSDELQKKVSFFKAQLGGIKSFLAVFAKDPNLMSYTTSDLSMKKEEIRNAIKESLKPKKNVLDASSQQSQPQPLTDEKPASQFFYDARWSEACHAVAGLSFAKSLQKRWFGAVDLKEPPLWIDSISGLEALERQVMASATLVALDCEFAHNRVSILQLAFVEKAKGSEMSKLSNVIIDILATEKDANYLLKCRTFLESIFESKIVLAFSLHNDIEHLDQMLDSSVLKRDNILDLQQLCSTDPARVLSLEECAKQYCAELPKNSPASWEKRPLQPNQFEYAALDAAVLPVILAEKARQDGFYHHSEASLLLSQPEGETSALLVQDDGEFEVRCRRLVERLGLREAQARHLLSQAPELVNTGLDNLDLYIMFAQNVLDLVPEKKKRLDSLNQHAPVPVQAVASPVAFGVDPHSLDKYDDKARQVKKFIMIHLDLNPAEAQFVLNRTTTMLKSTNEAVPAGSNDPPGPAGDSGHASTMFKSK